MLCNNCGSSNSDHAKFCNNCGAQLLGIDDGPVSSAVPKPINVPSSPAKQKKPFFSRWYVWAILVVFALGVIGSVSDSVSSEPTSSALTYRDVASFLKSEIDSKFSYTDISYDDTGMTIIISMDGVSSTCALARSGVPGASQPWNDILDSTGELARSTAAAFESIGYTDYVTSIIIVNDLNVDNMLAMFLNGDLVYNAASTS